MSELKATPGPWEYIECADDFDESCGVGMASYLEDPCSYETIHLWTCSDGKNDDEAVANAHLIAAAPDLYEALDNLLEECTKELGDPEDYIAALKAGDDALLKARGESPLWADGSGGPE